MPDLPPIHPGSHWEGDEIVDNDYFRLAMTKSKGGEPMLLIDETPVFAADVLAVLRRANLIPEVREVEFLRARVKAFEARETLECVRLDEELKLRQAQNELTATKSQLEAAQRRIVELERLLLEKEHYTPWDGLER